jgi:ribose transport system substrate-binding protein
MKRTIISTGLAIGLATALSAPSFADDIFFPVIAKGFNHQFWQAVKAGAEQAGKDNGVTVSFEGPEGEQNIDKQIDMINADIAKKPQGLALAALDSQAEAAVLKKVAAAGIPIVAFDSGVDSDLPLTTCTTDNVKAAALAADKLGEAVGGEGEIGVLVHDQTSKFPKLQIVDIQYGGDPLKATENAKAMLTAHPKLKGIFAANEGTAVGLMTALKETKAKIVAVGYDSGKQQKEAVMDGTFLGSITQNPVGIGKCAVDSLTKAVKGEKLEKIIDTGFYWYDKTNITSPEVAAVLYD